MAEKHKRFFLKILRVIRNKYFLVSLVFLIYICLLSQNNVYEKYNAVKNLNKLKKEKAYYINDIKTCNKKLSELKKDKRNIDNIETFAREQYMMKKDNEDLFVIIEKPKQ